MAKKRDNNSRENLKLLKELADTLFRDDPDLFREILSLKAPKIEPITPREWADTHPLRISCGSDKFYTDFANDLQRTIAALPGISSTPPGFIRSVAMSLTAYLEDLVGGIGVWQAIRFLSKELYDGAPLPPVFELDPDDYFDDDVNIQDLKIIVWQVFAWTAREKGTSYISPYSPAIGHIPEIVLPILAEALEKAPEPTRMADTIRRIFASGDIFEIRRLALWLSCLSPLTTPPGMDSTLDINPDINNRSYNPEHLRAAEYTHAAIMSWGDAISILGCPASAILAKLAIIYGFNAIAEKFEGFDCRPFSTYHVKEITPRGVILANDGGEEFSITSKSVNIPKKTTDIKYASLAMFKYGGLWWCNGGIALTPTLPPDHTIDDSNLREDKKIFRRIIHENRGRRVFFFKTHDEAMDFVNSAESDPAEGNSKNGADNYTLLISDEGIMAIIPGVAPFIKYKDNPFFQKTPEDKQLAVDASLHLLVNGKIPDDVAKFLQDNNMLPFLEVTMSQGRRFMKQHIKTIIRPSIALYRVPSPSYFLPDDDDNDD